jgi:hypothetical protein
VFDSNTHHVSALRGSRGLVLPPLVVGRQVHRGDAVGLPELGAVRFPDSEVVGTREGGSCILELVKSVFVDYRGAGSDPVPCPGGPDFTH